MLRAAEDRYRLAARLAAAVASLAGSAWDKVGLHALDSWQPAELAAKVAAVQLLLARGADAYLEQVLDEQNLTAAAVGAVEPRAFVGVAGNGVPLAALLDGPRIRAKVLIGEGLDAQEAWDRARNSVRLMAVTAVQDAGRAADSVAMVARPHVGGYVRMLNTPSCARCAILAGRFYKWNAGFSRHPKCDCRGVPTNEDVATDLRTNPMEAFRSGQVTGLSRADTQALTDGADFGQVINAHKGMETADVFGQRLKTTTANAKGAVRLRPESIYQVAKDREDALRLLRRFGYLLL